MSATQKTVPDSVREELTKMVATLSLIGVETFPDTSEGIMAANRVTNARQALEEVLHWDDVP